MKRSALKPSTKPMARKTPLARGTVRMKPRKSGKPTRTKAVKQHMGRVADLGCILCRVLGYGQTPAELHHPRRGTGMGQRAPDEDCIPLCPEHHRGNTGLHGLGTKGFTERYGCTEADLLNHTRALLDA